MPYEPPPRPEPTRIIGAAGKYSARMSRSSARHRRGAVFLAVLAGAAFAFLVSVAWVMHVQTRDDAAAALLVVAAAALVSCVVQLGKSSRWRKRALRQAWGAEAERAILDALVDANVTCVVNNADIGAGGDADEIVIHDFGDGTGVLAVIETKTGGGRVYWDGKHIITGKGRRIPGDPIGQVRRQAQELTRITHRPVQPIICIQFQGTKAFKIGEVIVCAPEWLGYQIRNEIRRIPMTSQDVAWIRRELTGH